MTPGHWREIEASYHAALEREDPSSRADYLAQLAPEIRKEVEELLSQDSAESPLNDRGALFEAIAPGAMLGHYRIEASIGAGGMGEVYRATDTKLRRNVAIKVCGAGFVRRFEREARAVAALNHPNICTLYESGPDYLVMELVEGPTLADRIRKGAIPINEATDIARQIAEALEAAHEQGIIHRDLKPANIKLTSDGRVKVLDFGLAKSITPRTSEAAATLTNTEQGLIVGTPSYMSPEQAEGLAIDKRTDIWSFGVVFWEMLTGHRLFDAQSASRILSEVLQREIDFTKLPSGTPDHIRTLLRRCLDRNLKTRLRDIGEARIALVDSPRTEAPRPKVQKPILAIAGWAVAAVLGVGLAWLVLAPSHRIGGTPGKPRSVFQFVAPEHNVQDIEISPDGATILIVGGGLNTVKKLWVRSLDKPETKLLATVDGIQWWGWSPDSQYIGYQARTKLYRIAKNAAEPPVLLGETPEPMDRGVWVEPGAIVVGGYDKFFRFRLEDRTLTKIYDQAGFAPKSLPGGRFTFGRMDGVYVGWIDGRPAVRIADKPAGFHYYVSPAFGSPYVVFAQDGAVIAQDFDPVKLQFLGAPLPIFELPGLVSVSQNGVLVTSYLSNFDNLAWVDRSGRLIRRVSPDIRLLSTLFKLSPDETRALVSSRNPEGNYDIWIAHLETGMMSRLTFAGSSGGALGGVWSPDNRNILWSTRKTQGKYLRPADGSGSDKLLFQLKGFPTDWSPDGKLVISNVGNDKGGLDLWTIPVSPDAEHKPSLYLEGGVARFHSGQFFPNGKWVAYTQHTQPPQIFVESFPPGRGRWQVTADGANEPRWRRDGTELFFFHGTEVWTVPVKQLPGSLEFGKPKRLFDLPISANIQATRDGQRFLVNLPVEQEDTLKRVITVDTDWRAGLLGKQP